MKVHDLVVRNGVVIDGTGAPRRLADVGISNGLITAVGEVGPGRREIDARGLVVAPGWVDIHTHYDGQATWDPHLAPSSQHGVTTAIMGNCGVGFAPARADRHDWLIKLMERVEDIPSSALAEGIKWGWTSFPEYLDRLEETSRTIDVATHVPHGALRAFVMGDRGAANEPATAEDIDLMAELVKEGLEAGALGFSTSRTLLHRAADGSPMPGTFAAADELLGIGRAMAAAGHGVFEMSSDMAPAETEFEWLRELASSLGVKITYALLQAADAPEAWRDLLDRTMLLRAAGGDVTAQIACRPTGMILGWQSSLHPFLARKSYWPLAALPFPERLERLKDPEVRAAILSDENPQLWEPAQTITQGFDRMFRLVHDGKVDYEPAREMSMAALADRLGVPPDALVYDLMMEDEGAGQVYLPLLNYAAFNFDHILEMLHHPATLVGLSDGGAHCGFICDTSFPTYLLTHWVRDRQRGPRLDLERAIEKQTRETAHFYGLHDRGVIAVGAKADLNLIDFDRLELAAPRMVFDLPAGGGRLMQGVSGYRATIVSGVVTFENGQATGELPGRLVRGPRSRVVAPAPGLQPA